MGRKESAPVTTATNYTCNKCQRAVAPVGASQVQQTEQGTDAPLSSETHEHQHTYSLVTSVAFFNL